MIQVTVLDPQQHRPPWVPAFETSTGESNESKLVEAEWEEIFMHA